eukprot:4116505-Pyramimonas_sp.AAC.1
MPTHAGHKAASVRNAKSRIIRCFPKVSQGGMSLSEMVTPEESARYACIPGGAACVCTLQFVAQTLPAGPARNRHCDAGKQRIRVG